MPYTVAGYTGPRASELASLSPGSFDLTAGTATATVEAAYSKHRRRDALPLHPELIGLLRGWLAGRDPGGPLWPGKWAAHCGAADLIKRDLSAARAAWLAAGGPAGREASDFLTYRDAGGRVADFHSLRHTFITRLVRAGVMPKEAKELARHSTITLTMDRYAHAGIADMKAAVSKLAGPRLAPEPDSGGSGRDDRRGYQCPRIVHRNH